MGMLGRAFGAGGAAVAGLANQYIDQELQQQKAKYLADLQAQSAKDMDAYNLSAPRQEQLRANESAGISSRMAATSAATRASDVAAAGDSDWNAAKDTLSTGQATREATAKAAALPITAEAEANADITKRGLTLESRIAESKQLAMEQASQERDNLSALGKDKEALAGMRAKAQALHIIGPGEQAQAELARFNLARSQMEALPGNPWEWEKAAKAYEEAAKVKSTALKILADPAASQQAQGEAMNTVREQELFMQHFAKKAGVDMTRSNLPPPQAIDDLFKNPKKLSADFDREYGAGSAAIVLGEVDSKKITPGEKDTGSGMLKPSYGGSITSDIDRGIISRLEPLVEEYRTAKEQMQAVAKSGDPKASSFYASALQKARDRLQNEADGRLGNGAPRFLAGVL